MSVTNFVNRPWACEFCPKRFPQVAEFSPQSISHLTYILTEILSPDTHQQFTVSLVISKAMHTANNYEHSTGEKPIKCPYCPDKFADPARRHKHVARVHSDMPTKRRRKAPFVLVSSKVAPDET